MFDAQRRSGNGEFGIALEEGSSGNRVVHNRIVPDRPATESSCRGLGREHTAPQPFRPQHARWLRIMGAGATLIGNSAARNGALGFNAPLGAALARRNHAHHNADRRQCVGISC